jgi:hypothetical protein
MKFMALKFGGERTRKRGGPMNRWNDEVEEY